MIDLIAAEFLKMRTTRTFWWVALVAVGLAVLATVVTLATGTTSGEQEARSLLSNMGIPGLFVIVLGVVGAAGEYRHGTITSTFLVAPNRRRVLVAKAFAYAIGGLAVGAASAALTLAISVPWLSGQGHSVGSSGLGVGDLAEIAGGTLAYMAISGMLGVAVGALLTNQVTAVVGVFVVLFVVDPVVAALAPGYGRFSLQGLGMKLSGGTGANAGYDLFGLGPAALVYLGYAVGLLAITAGIANRRDVG
jgi:ABC-2 type transport system permease protein